jgi:hypothetical protein
MWWEIGTEWMRLWSQTGRTPHKVLRAVRRQSTVSVQSFLFRPKGAHDYLSLEIQTRSASDEKGELSLCFRARRSAVLPIGTVSTNYRECWSWYQPSFGSGGGTSIPSQNTSIERCWDRKSVGIGDEVNAENTAIGSRSVSFPVSSTSSRSCRQEFDYAYKLDKTLGKKKERPQNFAGVMRWMSCVLLPNIW